MPKLPNIPPPERRKRRWVTALRNNFFTGLVVVAPIGMTLWLIWTITGHIDSWVLPFIPERFSPKTYIGIDLRGIGVIVFLIFTLLVGWMAKGLIGRSLLNMGEDLVGRMPVVRSVYNGLKQLAETVFAQSETSFDKVCLIEYPRKGLWAMAFISTSTKGEVNQKIPVEDQLISIFLPTTPNPTSGFLLFAPQSDIIELDMTVGDAMKLVISAGLVYPQPENLDQPSLPLEPPGQD
ncbi:MAG: hypothetical protein CSA68_07800 [Rhodobacterales bacterium]|nr:MAG: hypothetical protein CSA68_07800 [Rhodobacterales bacterium]